MTMAESEQIVLGVCSSLVARKDVMHVKDGGAFSTEEATATAVLIALEDAGPDVRRKL